MWTTTILVRHHINGKGIVTLLSVAGLGRSTLRISAASIVDKESFEKSWKKATNFAISGGRSNP